MKTISIPLADGWRFIKADDPSAGAELTMQAMSDLLDRADRGDCSGAPHFEWAQPSFDDSSWREVRVPHDWGVESPFDSDRRYGDAFLDVSGVGWYRIKLKVESGKWKVGGQSFSVSEDGKVYFECDGAMSYAMAFVNGAFAGGWPYGYTRWRIDITDHLKPRTRNQKPGTRNQEPGTRNQEPGTRNQEPGTRNQEPGTRNQEPGTDVTLAIRCHNVPDSSRWYTGGGLFRECRLLVCPKDHVVPGSVFITTPEVTPERATVRVRYEMSVSGPKERVFSVDNPHLWDIDDPYLYTVDIEGNDYRYGIRTIEFHADERRFQLNGRTVPLNGVSMHHDFSVLGAAWNRAAQKRRLLLFKEAGVNAIRSSHNPPDEGLLELCDELGLLVKDEVFDEWRKIGAAGKRKNGYTNLFDKWHERDVRAWVRTDRNHPCVIMYSVGNEICEGFDSIAPLSEFSDIARHLAGIVADEDPTRPATNANNNHVNFTNEYPTVLPLMGCNYYSWKYPALKQAHPNVPFFGSETICMSSTRGEYHFPVLQKWNEACGDCGENFYNSSYCWEAVNWENLAGNWACSPDAQWYWMDLVKTCMGEFIWTGIDYLGGPFWCDEWRKKPRFTDPVAQERALAEVSERCMTRAAIHTCNTGFLDQAGFKKDAFWLFQSRWRPDFPMAHILPHWNWEGREGEVTPVYVFTSGDEGELFLNGRSLGRRRKEPGVWDRAYRLRWDEVRYEPGVLEVVVYKDGAEWARDRVETTGAPDKLVIEPESDTILSNGQDIAYVNVSVRDAAGRVVPRASNRIEFVIEGPGTIIATDNGDETDFDDFRQPTRKAFNGWAQALVRAKAGEAGEIRITAISQGLESATAVIRSC
jgi:beta-galactosidase